MQIDRVMPGRHRFHMTKAKECHVGDLGFKVDRECRLSQRDA